MFYPLTGIVGLNNIKANDYLNVVLQVRMMVALFPSVALLCSNIWKNVISLKMHLITGS